MQTILEQVNPETAERIAAEARVHGLSVDAYLQHLLTLASKVPLAMESGETKEFVAAMESLAEDSVLPLPRDFSREHMYFPEA